MLEGEEYSFISKVIVNTEEFEKSLNDVVEDLKKRNVPIETRKILSDYIVKDYLIFRFRVDEIANLIRIKRFEDRIKKIESLSKNELFRCIVIVELSSLNIHPMIRDAILEMFLRLFHLGIGVLISYSSSMTARLIELIFRDKHAFNYSVKKIKSPSNGTELTVALAMLQSIPGIGPKRAAKLLYEFGSILNIALSNPEEISKRAEIPLSTAEMIVEALNKDFTDHQSL